jgi:aldose 1-epimerase
MTRPATRGENADPSGGGSRLADQIKRRPFGTLPTGESVDAYDLVGAGGVTLTAIQYGGIVTRLLVPDRRGEFADVVLGFDSLNGYLGPHPFFGAIAGRVAGRITGARFALDGREYRLEANDPPNTLHGGSRGFDRRLWDATPVTRADGAPSLRLSRQSAFGEEGFPGNVRVAVTYTVTADNRFVIDVEATADHATPFSLTHHSYFNLAGRGTTADHTLQVFANDVAAHDEKSTLLGRRESVDGRPGDLRVARRLGDVVPHLAGEHGDLYFIDRTPGDGKLVTAAKLVDPASGRAMTVNTTEDCLQFYTGTKLDGTIVGKGGRRCESLAGLCLEAEGYPDGVNVPSLGDIVLRPGKTLRHTTEYAFSNL